MRSHSTASTLAANPGRHTGTLERVAGAGPGPDAGSGADTGGGATVPAVSTVPCPRGSVRT